MFEFAFNPLEVGNIPTVGLAEEMMEDQVDQCVDYIASNYGMTVPVYVVDRAIAGFGIDFQMLPRWIQEKFDVFDVY